MNLLKKLLLNILILLFVVNAQAQTHRITGTVVGANGEPLQGVTIEAKDLNKFTTTLADGSFSIEVPGRVKTLIFTYSGMERQEVNVSEKTNVQVELKQGSSVLSDVVVVGYGTQRRKDLTGSIASLGAEKFEERPVVNFLEAMSGQAAGLQVSQGNASPGQLSNVIVRGISTISAGYEPLFVVDGFPTTQANANAINPTDIQSVEILKDASATGIYGSRGANGVILITTKSAKPGKPSIYLDIIGGWAEVNKKDLYPMLNAAEYVQYSKEIATNNGGPLPTPVANWDGVTNTDWQKLVYRSAPYQNYSLSITGGSNTANYNLSMGYIDQDGIVKSTNYKKYSLRTRIDFRPSENLRIALNIAPNYTVSKNMPDGDFILSTGGSHFYAPDYPGKNAGRHLWRYPEVSRQLCNPDGQPASDH